MNWTDRFKKRVTRQPSINDPVVIPQMEKPLPDPTKDRPTKNWIWYNRTQQGRDWVKKERRA